uniref:ATPase inhibitor, mitochondrial n=1 Tax=Eptatretus burgeri TaxID=7764 RepID=A0A8C4R2Z8_EPTBU
MVYLAASCGLPTCPCGARDSWRGSRTLRPPARALQHKPPWWDSNPHELGSGVGKGGGGGGSVREAGGSFGKKEAAEEEMYFRKLQSEQLQKLQKHHAEEIKHHKIEIDRLKQEIGRHQKKIKDLDHDD